MLVFSRKKNEDFVIPLTIETLKKLVDAGEDVEISVVCIEIRGDKTRLGIDAPPDVPVHRREVQDRILSGSVRPIFQPMGQQ